MAWYLARDSLFLLMGAFLLAHLVQHDGAKTDIHFRSIMIER
jgi:hypothetical protein